MLSLVKFWNWKKSCQKVKNIIPPWNPMWQKLYKTFAIKCIKSEYPRINYVFSKNGCTAAVVRASPKLIEYRQRKLYNILFHFLGRLHFWDLLHFHRLLYLLGCHYFRGCLNFYGHLHFLRVSPIFRSSLSFKSSSFFRLHSFLRASLFLRMSSFLRSPPFLRSS